MTEELMLPWLIFLPPVLGIAACAAVAIRQSGETLQALPWRVVLLISVLTSGVAFLVLLPLGPPTETLTTSMLWPRVPGAVAAGVPTLIARTWAGLFPTTKSAKRQWLAAGLLALPFVAVVPFVGLLGACWVNGGCP